MNIPDKNKTFNRLKLRSTAR